MRRKGSHVYVFGSRPRGTLYGLYALLEKNTDLIFARPNGEFGTVYGSTPEFVLRETDFIDIPVFLNRRFGPNWPAHRGTGEWLLRNRDNTRDVRANYKGFLDLDLIQVAQSIPPELKLFKNDNGQIIEKWVLRKAFEDLLPSDIVWRDKEQFDEGSGTTDFLADVVGCWMTTHETEQYAETHRASRLRSRTPARVLPAHAGERDGGIPTGPRTRLPGEDQGAEGHQGDRAARRRSPEATGGAHA